MFFFFSSKSFFYSCIFKNKRISMDFVFGGKFLNVRNMKIFKIMMQILCLYHRFYHEMIIGCVNCLLIFDEYLKFVLLKFS